MADIERGDFDQQLRVSIPRSVLQRIRRQFPGESVEGAVAKACAYVAEGKAGNVLLSPETVRELCSTLSVRSVNSEKDILEALRERLHAGPNTVSFDLDPNLAVSVRESANGNDIPFAEMVKEYIQLGLDTGLFDQRHELFSLFFTKAQQSALKAVFNGKLTAENVVAAVQHWHRLTESEVTSQKGA